MHRTINNYLFIKMCLNTLKFISVNSNTILNVNYLKYSKLLN